MVLPERSGPSGPLGTRVAVGAKPGERWSSPCER